MKDEDLARLAESLAGSLGARVTVRDARRLSAGASRTTWFVDLEVAGEDRTIVVQRERPGGTRASSGMAGEAALLRAAHEVGVPVAPVLGVDDLAGAGGGAGATGGPGAWIALGLVDGETIPRRILRGLNADTSRRLLQQCAAALAGIHRIRPVDRFGLSTVDQVAEFRSVLDVLGDPQPVFEVAFRWLGRHQPARRGAATVVHGDFRLGNIVVGPDGLAAVLDWELAHVGDPVEDLGWFSARAWRFGAGPAVGGLGTIEELLDAYTAHGGRAVAADELRWWQVLATLKWGIMCLVQAATHQSGASRSVELAAIGRRVVETQEDLLELIAGPPAREESGPATGGDPAAARDPGIALDSDGPVPGHPWGPLGGPGGPTVRPTGAQLLEAVGEYLATVRDEVPGHIGFHARVAANVVEQVGRELRLGAVVADRHRDRLLGLGVADDRALAAAIRDGSLDVNDPAVLGTLRSSVRDALAVVHPGYATSGLG